MNESQEKMEESERLPDGFIYVSLDQLLSIIAVAIMLAGSFAAEGTKYLIWIVLPFAFVLMIAAVAARRGVRKFVKKHGKIELTLTFEPETNRPKKSVLFREVGELIDDAVDRILDGKEKK